MKILISHLIQSLNHPTPLIILEARLVRWLMTRDGKTVPEHREWVNTLAAAHSLMDYKHLAQVVLRYDRRDLEAGRVSTLFALLMMAFVIGAFMLIALAGQTGAALSETVAQMDMPAAEVISYDGLAGDIESSMAEITQASKDYSISHGLEHHGQAAQMVRDCIAKSGPRQTWEDPDGHRIQICQLSTGQIGFQVETQRGGAWKSLTEYIKQRFHSLADVARYMRNGGAELK